MALSGTGADGLYTKKVARFSLVESKRKGENARNGCKCSAEMGVYVAQWTFFFQNNYDAFLVLDPMLIKAE